MTTSSPAYSHAKCFARSLQNCSQKISAEHYISNNVLRWLSGGGTAEISGLPWVQPSTFARIGIGSLTGNMLCEAHNHALSALDTEAGRFFRTLANVDTALQAGAGTNESFDLSGAKLERWMLKMVCGMVATNQIASNAARIPAPLEDDWVRILFEVGHWPDAWGLYFAPSAETQHYRGFGFTPMIGPDNRLRAARFEINNFLFNLVLGRPDDPNAWGIRRPRELAFTNSQCMKTLVLDWGDSSFSQRVELKFVGTYQGKPANWPTWDKP